MEILLTLLCGVVLGAAIIYLALSSVLKRTQRSVDALEAECDAVRAAHGAAEQALARLEAQREAELRAAAEKLALLQDAQTRLQESFKVLSSEALAKNNESFLSLAKTALEKYQANALGDLDKRQAAIHQTVEPVSLALKAFNERVERIETRRTATDASLQQQLQQLAESQAKLSKTTGSLVQALRAPQVRGQWGEMQLRRTVEMAGMVNRVDFLEQASVDTADGQRQRPDMLINLPNGRQVVVDSKVPLAAYLDALEADDPAVQTARMQAHARHICEHIKGLSAKSYWTQFENTPEFVVLFIPNETIFSAALEQDPALIELGVDNKVILATPTTLIALLKAIAFGWQQEAIAREAKEIAALGKELYQRISIVTGHFTKLGKSLEQSVGHYNKTLNSIESRLMVTARKFEALDSAAPEPLPEPKGIEKIPILPQGD